MFSSEKIQKLEQESTEEMFETLREMIRHEREVYRNAKTDDERNVSEAKLKSYAKTLNEMKSCEDHAYMADKLKLEKHKADEANKESIKSRKWDIGKTILNTGSTICMTVYTVIQTKKCMNVCEGWEQIHYASTTAQKKAIEACCDLIGSVHKVIGKLKFF